MNATRSFEPWFMRSVVNASVKMMQRSARLIEVEEDAGEDVLLEGDGCQRIGAGRGRGRRRQLDGRGCPTHMTEAVAAA